VSTLRGVSVSAGLAKGIDRGDIVARLQSFFGSDVCRGFTPVVIVDLPGEPATDHQCHEEGEDHDSLAADHEQLTGSRSISEDSGAG
jgi:hypothetical protein